MHKVIYFAIAICCAATAFYWHKHSTPTFTLDDVEMTQAPLDIMAVDEGLPEKVWCVKTNSNMVYARLVFLGEGQRSFSQKPGLLDLLLAVLPEGAGARDGVELKRFLSDRSIGISFSASRDNIVVDVSCLKKHFNSAIGVLCDMLSSARLPEHKIDSSRQEMILATQQSLSYPEAVAQESLNNLLYASDHPYHQSSKGLLSALPKYTRSDLQSVYGCIFSKDHLRVTFVSSLDNTEITQALGQIKKAVAQKKTLPIADAKQSVFPPAAIKFVELDNPQSSICFAFPGVVGSSTDVFSASLASDVLGGISFVSRLFFQVRGKLGLAYHISTQTDFDNDLFSCVAGIAGTRPENAEKVIDAIKTECKKLCSDGVSEEELRLAKIRTFSKFSFTSGSNILNFVSLLRRRGVDVGDVNSYLSNFAKVSVSDVNSMVRKLFSPDRMVLVACGTPTQKNTNAENGRTK
ncbi:MAG: insulinase family protein [Alphaproteobacteria bacterium]|nr:insulinase family protein [Alphaproteobacteria bacterium]